MEINDAQTTKKKFLRAWIGFQVENGIVQIFTHAKTVIWRCTDEQLDGERFFHERETLLHQIARFILLFNTWNCEIACHVLIAFNQQNGGGHFDKLLRREKGPQNRRQIYI